MKSGDSTIAITNCLSGRGRTVEEVLRDADRDVLVVHHVAPPPGAGGYLRKPARGVGGSPRPCVPGKGRRGRCAPQGSDIYFAFPRTMSTSQATWFSSSVAQLPSVA